jgi:hypothetical protein
MNEPRVRTERRKPAGWIRRAEEKSMRGSDAVAAESTPLDLWRGEDGQLWVRSEGNVRAVRVVRCFPWSDPGRYVSLRDSDDEEVALVSDLSELGPGARRALTRALVEAAFVLEIEAILAVEEEIEIRTFRVRTKQGLRSFQTLRDEWPRELPGGGLLVEDVVGDLYLVRDPTAMDGKSRRLMWAFLD